MKARGPGIKFKLVASFFLLSFLPLTALGFYMFEKGKADIIESKIEALSTDAASTALEIKHFVDTHLIENISRLTGMLHFRSIAAEIYKGGFNGAAARKKMRKFLEAYRHPGGDILKYFFLHPGTGEVLVSTDPLEEGKFFGKRPYFIKGREALVISRVHYSLTAQRNILALSAPVKDSQGKLLGVMAGWANFERMQEMLAPVSHEGSYLVNRSNLFVLGSREDTVPILTGVFTSASVSALAGRRGSGIYNGPGGDRVVGAYEPIGSLGLALVVEVPLSDVLSDVNAFGKRVLYSTLGLAAFVLYASVLIGDRITKPVLKMTQAAKSIASGQFGHRVGYSSSDELGGLSKSMNRMALSLAEREEALRAALQKIDDEKARAEAVIAAIGDGLSIQDRDYKILYQNITHKDMVGSHEGEFCYRAYEKKEETCQGCPLAEAFEDGMIHTAERTADVDGKVLHVEITASPVKDRTGKIVSGIEVVRDITQRKKAEETIAVALREKEVLLREVHHRVKNNLQIVSSLLKLQSAGIGSKEAHEVLLDSRSRIKAMALLHDRLYSSGDLSNIDFAHYVRSLAIDLFRSQKQDIPGIELNVEAEEVSLDVDRAVPCGLILTELITNSLRHAFPNGGKGEVRVGLKLTDEGLVCLSVGDNGVGLPAAMLRKDIKTLGLSLVRTLSEQIGAAIEVAGSGGAEFKITFPHTMTKTEG